MDTALIIGALLLIGSVLFAEACEKIAAFLKQWTLTLCLTVAVAVLVVQASPRMWNLLKQRSGEIAKPVAAVVHASSHR